MSRIIDHAIDRTEGISAVRRSHIVHVS